MFEIICPEIAMKGFFSLLSCIFPLDYLNKPGAPFASTIGSHHITLGWKPANISEVKYIIQWKFHQLPGDWRYTEVKKDNSFYFARFLWIYNLDLLLWDKKRSFINRL